MTMVQALGMQPLHREARRDWKHEEDLKPKTVHHQNVCHQWQYLGAPLLGGGQMTPLQLFVCELCEHHDEGLCGRAALRLESFEHVEVAMTYGAQSIANEKLLCSIAFVLSECLHFRS